MMNVREFLEGHPDEKKLRKLLKTGLWPIDENLSKEDYKKAFRSSGVQLSRFLSGELKSLRFWQMEKLFHILGISPNQFFGYEVEKPPAPEPILNGLIKDKQTSPIDQLLEKHRGKKLVRKKTKVDKANRKLIVTKVTVE